MIHVGLVAWSKPLIPKFGYSIIKIWLVGNVGKIIRPTVSHPFFLACDLRIYLYNILELRTQGGSWWQNFFPKNGETENQKNNTVSRFATEN